MERQGSRPALFVYDFPFSARELLALAISGLALLLDTEINESEPLACLRLCQLNRSVDCTHAIFYEVSKLSSLFSPTAKTSSSTRRTSVSLIKIERPRTLVGGISSDAIRREKQEIRHLPLVRSSIIYTFAVPRPRPSVLRNTGS